MRARGFHASSIRCLNEIKQGSAPAVGTEDDGEMIAVLRDAVSAFLLLARSGGWSDRSSI